MEAAEAYAGATHPEYSSAYDVGIGNAAASGFDVPFSGDIDAVRISRTVRSAAEIAGIRDRSRR
jgi:hypothetical protein